MQFKNRAEAGSLLAEKLKKYKNKDVVVYGMPRGGVVTAYEIARYLNAPLDLIIARKIGHPQSPEYAIAAVGESGSIVSEINEVRDVNRDWFEDEVERQKEEIKRRKKLYLQGKKMILPTGKIAILVDDGVATGLTLRVGIVELKHDKPAKIVVAVPVVARSTASILEQEADELVALEIPSDYEFLGAVGAYYDSFPQVEDEEVVEILHNPTIDLSPDSFV